MSDLLKINVNDHTEKKQNLTYLSWAWAWAEVLKLDPGARWHAVEYSNERGCALPCMFLPDGSAMVKTEVTIKGETKTCMLPVMDHRNKAIKNPDAFAINTAIMRCMTKAISMHGLGLYIYAGEDLPEADTPEPITLTPPPPTHEKKRNGAMADVIASLPPLTPEEAERFDRLAATAIDDFRAYGAQAAYERIEQHALTAEEKIHLWSRLPSDMRSALKKYGEQFAPKKAAA